MRQVALLRAGSREALVWLQVQGDLLLTGPPARGEPSTSRLSSSR
jgi:hypothetical protein